MSVSIEDFNDLKARLFAAEMEIEELKTSALTPSRAAPEPKLTPVKEAPSKPDEGGHIAGDEKSKSGTAALKLWIDSGREAIKDAKSYTYVQTCDEFGCIAPDHREVMPKTEARSFNSRRVDRLLEEFGAGEMFDYIVDNSTRISDGHIILNSDDGTFVPLPGGRKVSALKAAAFAYEICSLPMRVKRTCKYDGCISHHHLEAKPA